MAARAGRHGPVVDDHIVLRACDQCRARKVRCDKSSPCSNCRTSNRTCSSTGAGQRPSEPKQRILISEKYEKKIDLIDDRLANIEELLRGVSLRPSYEGYSPSSDSTHHHRASRSTPIPPVFHLGAASNAPPDGGGSEPSPEGADSSMPASTIFADEFIEVAARHTSSHPQGMNPDVSAALSSLRRIVSLHKTQSASSDAYRFPRQKDISPGGLSQLPMPPLAVTMAEIERIKDNPPSVYGYIALFLVSEDFRDRCRKVYFKTEDYTCCTYVIVNAALYYLFLEQSFTTEDAERRTAFTEYSQICQSNLDTALGNLPMFLPARCETIEALQLGALYAIEISRPSLAWQLVSKAAGICKTLGYHKKKPPGPLGASHSTYLPDGVDVHALMFWHTYILDSCLSLRMGCPPAIQEWDIEISVDDLSLSPYSLNYMLIAWARHSAIQNKLYKYLYSPAALTQSPAELESWARRLSKELVDLSADAGVARKKARESIKQEDKAGFMEMHLLGDEVTLYSTLTLAYRAIPPPEGAPSRFCPECIDAARLTMRAHQHCMAHITQGDHLKAVYIHWAIILTPFAPFFVLLCHVIDTFEVSDLQLLEDFTTSLVPAIPLSEATQKLHRLCQVMCSIARYYVEARHQQGADEGMRPIGDEFEMYLGELGFMNVDPVEPPSVNAPASQGDAFHGQAHASSSAQLADWFSSNKSIMALLEEDLEDIDPIPWNP